MELEIGVLTQHALHTRNPTGWTLSRDQPGTSMVILDQRRRQAIPGVLRIGTGHATPAGSSITDSTLRMKAAVSVVKAVLGAGVQLVSFVALFLVSAYDEIVSVVNQWPGKHHKRTRSKSH